MLALSKRFSESQYSTASNTPHSKQKGNKHNYSKPSTCNLINAHMFNAPDTPTGHQTATTTVQQAQKTETSSNDISPNTHLSDI